jgi:hypothetical protein
MLDGSEIDLISSFSEDEQNEEEELPQQQQQQQVTKNSFNLLMAKSPLPVSNPVSLRRAETGPNTV